VEDTAFNLGGQGEKPESMNTKVQKYKRRGYQNFKSNDYIACQPQRHEA